MSNCYNKECDKKINYEKTGTFFCNSECKRKYNRFEKKIAKKNTWTIPAMQARLKMLSLKAKKRNLVQQEIFS